MNRNKNDLLLLGILLVLACLIYLPFVFQDTLGEPDSFRMANGLVYSIRNNIPFEGPLLFRVDASFGYYALLYLFTPIFKANLALVIPFMNYINAISAILMVIPFFFVVKRYWGTVTAVSANLLLFFVPIWWNSSLYGHPMLPAIFFNFVGLALIGLRFCVASRQGMWWKLVGLDGLIITAFFLCLAFRFDALLWLFPLIPCCLLLERYSLKQLMLYSILFGVLPFIIFFTAQSLVVGITPNSVATGIGGQILERALTLNHATAISVPVLVSGVVTGGLAYHPLYLLAFGLSCFYLAYQRRYRTLLFILPIFILNFFFWIPNPIPARHFIYPTPLLAIGAALGLSALSERVKYLANKNRLSSFIPLTLLFVLTSLITSELLYVSIRTYYPGPNEPPAHLIKVPIRAVFINSTYTEKHFRDAAHFAQALQQLEAKDKAILVVAEALPVLLELQLLSQEVRELQTREETIDRTSLRLYFLRNERNFFIIPLAVAEKRDELAKLVKKFDDVYLAVDPAVTENFPDSISNENTLLLEP
jgi:hypothetical protein